MNGSRFIAETFSGYGVTHVFFMPVILPGALREMEQLGIQLIMTHAEKPAAYMADAYARMRRSTGVCMSQSVGAVNLAAGLQDAYLGCAPVLAITGRQVAENLNRHAYQEVDHMAPFSAVTKFSAHVNDAAALPGLLQKALHESVSNTPGPVHLDLEGFVGHIVSKGEVIDAVSVDERFMSAPPTRPAADAGQVRQAVELLSNAKQPIIVAGGGVTTSDAAAELLALAEKMSIPVATSLNAKTAIPWDHPLAVGVCGSYSRECANRALAEADLIVFVGSHTGGQVTNDWRLPPRGTRIIQIDINADEIGRNYPLALGIHADARVALASIAAAATPVSRDAWTSRVQDLVANWRESVAEIAHSDELPMRPERLCHELTEHLPDDAILVSDTGHAGIWTGTMIDFKHPGQSYLRCAGSLGWAVPAAIGAKCAAPERPVICFTGDGGAWYHITELETAARYSIPAIFVINNNASLNQERTVNERIYGGATPQSDALWHLSDTDFAALAETMGCLGMTVREPQAIEAALTEAIASNRPTVIDVKTHIDGIAPPAWTP